MPKLRNETWNTKLSRIAPHLDGFQTRLDDVSHDIRALEKYLTDTGFRISVQLWWGHHSEWGVAWVPLGNSWRLCYVIDHGNDQPSFQPLIETPAAIRLEAARHFDRFLDELAKAAGEEDAAQPPEAPPSSDDIPF